MALPKGRSNSGVKNLEPFHFKKGKSGYHFKPREIICAWCSAKYISTVGHSKFCKPKCREDNRTSLYVSIRDPKEQLYCQFCDKEFLSKARLKFQRFCSKQCSGMYTIATGKLNYVTKALIHYENKCNRCGNDDDTVLVVHHIDHSRENNCITNLEIVCANCHHKHHHGRGERRRKKMIAIKEFILKHPEWRVKNAPSKRTEGEN
jgi:5-methylcytosine-specific restriction endonuclease McrA